MYCRNCGSQIDDGVQFCPFCGASVRGAAPSANRVNYNPQPQVAAAKKTNGWGITGFVFALIGIFAGSLFGIVPAIAFVCSVVGTALRHRRNSCNALAVWGLVLSLISLIFWIIIFAFFGTLLSW